MNINDIPELLTLPLRLGIISSLVINEKTFNELKAITKASDGNLSIQISKLKNANYLISYKKNINKKIQTVYSITDFGLSCLESYVLLLESILLSSKS